MVFLRRLGLQERTVVAKRYAAAAEVKAVRGKQYAERDGSRAKDSGLQFAIVGFGTAGRAYGALLQALSSVSVSCVVDADRRRAQAGARALSAAAWSDNADAALRRDDVDAVIVATPHASHWRLAREALDRGLHVLLEAPLALRYSDAQHVLAYARASDSVLAVNFWARAAPDVRLIRGRIPRPTFLRIESVVDPLHDSWMGSARHGGLLALLGSHALDLACFLMQSQPIYVQAMGGRHTRRADLADTIAAGIRFANGGLARVTVGEYGRSPTSSTWRLMATDGAVTATAKADLPEDVSRIGGLSDVVTPHSHPADAPLGESLQAFVDAVAGNGEPLAGVEDGVRAVQLADAVYESMGARRRIPIAETSLHVGVGPIYADDSVPNRRNHGFGS